MVSFDGVKFYHTFLVSSTLFILLIYLLTSILVKFDQQSNSFWYQAINHTTHICAIHLENKQITFKLFKQDSSEQIKPTKYRFWIQILNNKDTSSSWDKIKIWRVSYFKNSIIFLKVCFGGKRFIGSAIVFRLIRLSRRRLFVRHV